MAQYFTNESAGYFSKPVIRPSSAAWGAKVRRHRASLNLSTINGGAAVTTADNVYLGKIPAGAVFCYGMFGTTVTLGTTTHNIGLSTTHAANTQYLTGGVYTTTNIPVLFGMVTDPGGSLGSTFTSLPYGQTATWGMYEMAIFTAPLPERDLYLTLGTANWPVTNNLVVIDTYWSYST